MNVENIKFYLSFLTPVLGIILATTIFFKNKIKNKKLKNILEHAEELTKNIIPFIIEAEKFSNYTGSEKKEYVITRLQQYAIKNNIKFDNELISNKIEELIDMSRNVNSNKEISNTKVEEKIASLIESMKE